MFTSGYLEDPTTGSANGNLAAYLLEHNFFGESEINYRVEQGYSIGRPSVLKIQANKIEDNFLMQVGGSIFVTAEGKWI